LILGENAARDRFWNLSKTWVGLSHRFLTLDNGFKFHYVCTEEPEIPGVSSTDKPLVIFLHGFPDSWAIWRHLLSSTTIRDGAVVVAVDLPGYGGSDGMKKYRASDVLDSLTGFVVAMRDHYGIDNEDGGRRTRKVVIVGHDWGCALAFRLAADAPQLADRFIVTNGPLVSVDALVILMRGVRFVANTLL
jgi:pimeloyl-ACP methyl ester carboxylesterase